MQDIENNKYGGGGVVVMAVASEQPIGRGATKQTIVIQYCTELCALRLGDDADEQRISTQSWGAGGIFRQAQSH
jgi:hypothetical protein